VFADGRGAEQIAGQLTGFSGLLQVDERSTPSRPRSAARAPNRGLSSTNTSIAPADGGDGATDLSMPDQLSSQSKLAEAINYTLNHRDGPTLFLRDGCVEVYSNRSSVQCARLRCKGGTHCSAAARAAREPGNSWLDL
jgi:hypothetical protein